MPGRRFLVFFLCVPAFTALAQDFTVPSGWRKPTSTLSQEERANISQSVIDTIAPLFNASSGQIDALEYTQSANLLCAIANHDFIAGNKKNEGTSANHLETTFQIHPGYFEPPNWALAAIYAYRAYGEQYLLNIATSVWDQTSVYMVTQADINGDTGTHPKKNTTFLASCDGATNVGAVFYLVDNDLNVDVNGATIGGFMALSAHLYEATKDNKYGDAAELSAAFIKNHLYNGTIIMDTITLAGCANNGLSVTYNSGFFIEGLSVYANVTGNSTWTAFLNNLIATTIKFPTWTGVDGVITEGAKSPSDAATNGFGQALKGIFIRGLYEAWSRSVPNSDVANLIKSFYNSLLDLARDEKTNFYSPDWKGPPPTSLLPWGQLAAIDTLNAALGMGPNASSTSGPTATAIQPGKTNGVGDAASGANKPNAGLIAGVTVGAVVLLLVVIGVVVFILRRRRRSNQELGFNESYLPRPYSHDNSDMARADVNQYYPVPSTTMSQTLLNPPDSIYQSSTQGVFSTSTNSFGTASRKAAEKGSAAPIVLTYSESGRHPTSRHHHNAQSPTHHATESTSQSAYSESSRAGSSRPAQSSSSPGATSDTEDGPESITELVQRLNRAMAKLPPGGNGSGPRVDDLEEPPQYSA
ncbi:hypothetical protein K474DRAFT_1710153 [Panus rudis PR-1116 ss-1]|nr:hypothetical protein K474DRAFT_1710153 [Panus rudis PR-1116 ss-1]